MAIVGNELFVKVDGILYSNELDGQGKRQHAKWRRREFVPDGKLITVKLK
ncbi:unnamed protein product [Hymenolepis diminuta]|uniref:Uncharacterized protein n=1 Tax=Hymenolepis diminuta TaxID=6216 RepID=A0A564Y1C8_HYMDI|nr:unnamed protein product [Hymenolepis diminuta]